MHNQGNPLIESKRKTYMKLQDATLRIYRGKEISKKELNKNFVSDEKTNLQYLELSKIEDGIIHYDKLKYLKPSIVDYLNSLDTDLPVIEYKGEFIILSRSEPFKIAYFDNDTSKHSEVIASNNMYFLLPRKEVIDPYYLVAYLDSKAGRKQIEQCAYGKIIKAIRLREFRKIDIPRYDKEIEQQIAKRYKGYLEQMAKTKNLYKELNEENNNLFNS